jgi:hypothetical protein
MPHSAAVSPSLLSSPCAPLTTAPSSRARSGARESTGRRRSFLRVARYAASHPDRIPVADSLGGNWTVF